MRIIDLLEVREDKAWMLADAEKRGWTMVPGYKKNTYELNIPMAMYNAKVPESIRRGFGTRHIEVPYSGITVKSIKEYKDICARWDNFDPESAEDTGLYSKLEELKKEALENGAKIGRQLFLPRPQVFDQRKSGLDRNWTYSYDDHGNLKEDAPVLLPGNHASGMSNKPGNGFWTSTLRWDGKKAYSDWVKLVIGNYPEWYNPIGYVLDVVGNPRILELDDYLAQNLFGLFFNRMDPVHREILARDYQIRNLPWKEIAKHFDGIHYRGGRGYHDETITRGWECESTCWFNSEHLKFIGKAQIVPKDDREENY